MRIVFVFGALCCSGYLMGVQGDDAWRYEGTKPYPKEGPIETTNFYDVPEPAYRTEDRIRQQRNAGYRPYDYTNPNGDVGQQQSEYERAAELSKEPYSPRVNENKTQVPGSRSNY